MNLIAALRDDVITDCVNHGLTLQVSVDGIKVCGFYKSDYVNLVEHNSECFTAESRYGQRDEIRTFKDLVKLNFEWWQKSRSRSEAWHNPKEPWLSILQKYGFISVEKKVLEVTIVKEL